MEDQNIIIVDISVDFNRLNGGFKKWIEQEARRILINRIYKTMIVRDIRVLNEMTPLNLTTMTIRVKVEVLDSIRYNLGDVVEGVLNLTTNPITFYSGNLKCTFSESSYNRQMDNIEGRDNVRYYNGDRCKAVIEDLKYIHGNIFIYGTVSLFSKVSSNDNASSVNSNDNISNNNNVTESE